MIIGVSHITLSCENVEADSKWLLNSRGKIKFMHSDLDNHPAKCTFLQEYETKQGMAFCQMPRGPAIELTQHSAALTYSDSAYQVFWSAPPKNIRPEIQESPAYEKIWRESIKCKKPKRFLWMPFKAQIWYDETKTDLNEPFIKAVLLPVQDMDKALHFWCKGLGFRMTDEGVAWKKLTFNSIMESWKLDLILTVSHPLTARPVMDVAGFPCLSMLCTKIEQVSSKILECNLKSNSGIFEINVNNKMLKVALFQGPNDEIVELIEFKR
jgi:hypothetical protein